MKKIRPQRSAPIPISLSSKRVSLAEEQMAAPYKMDWRSPPLQPVDSNTSKAFFQNMKAELSTIKNDFEKLIRKDVTVKNEKEEPSKSSSVATKNKCMSTNKREERKVSERYPQNQKFQQQNSHKESLLNMEKNFPCLNEENIKLILAKTVQLKEGYNKAVPTRTISTPFDQVELGDKEGIISQQSARLLGQKEDKQKQKEKQLEILKLKENTAELQSKLVSSKEQINRHKIQIQKLSKQKHQLSAHLEEIGSELSSKVEIMSQQESKIRLLNGQLQKFGQSNEQVHQLQQQFSNQRNFYTSKINELMFHNQNLGGINMQLGQQNEMLKQNVFGLQNFVQDFKKRTADLQGDSKRKIQYLQRDLGEYQKREDMFSRQIDRLNRELKEKPQQQQQQQKIQQQQITPQPTACSNYPGQVQPNSLHQLHEQIISLKDEIIHLKNQVQIEKQIHKMLSEKYEEQINNMKIQELSQQFQKKLNELVDQNGKLKNRINLCESTVESLTEQNKSYLEQINIYEERERNIIANKKLSPNQWQQMTDTIEKLREENRKLLDEIEFINMKQDVEKCENSVNSVVVSSQNDNLLQLASCQLAENQQLKQNIKQLSFTIKLYEEQLQSLQFNNAKLQQQLFLNKASGHGSTDLANIQSRHNELYGELQRKQEQLKNLKFMILKVLIQKATKYEDESEMDYYLRQLDQRFSAICEK